MFHFLTKRTERTQRGAALAKTNISIALLSLFLLFTLALSCVSAITITDTPLAKDIPGAPAGKVTVGFQDLLEVYLPDGTVAENVIWSSSSSDIVEIDPITGIYVTRNVGTATISYTYGTKTGSTTIVVTDEVVPAVSIDIDSASKPAGNISINDTDTLTASISPADHTDGNIRWSSSNSEFVSINAKTGVYTATGIGTASITAQIGSVSDTTDIQVLDGSGSGGTTPAQSMVFDPQAPSALTVNDAGTLSVNVTPANHTDGDVVWQSSNPSVLSLSSSGPTTASYSALSTSFIPVTITASIGTVTISSGPITVSSEEISELRLVGAPTSAVSIGVQGLLELYLSDGTRAEGVKWTSSSEVIVSIDQNTGVYIPLMAGTATVFYEYDTRTGSTTIEVTGDGGSGGSNSAQSIEFISPPDTLTQGAAGTFSVVVTPTNHIDGNVLWESSPANLLAITSTGPNTASYFVIGAGTVTITARVGTTIQPALHTVTITSSGDGNKPALALQFDPQTPTTLMVNDTGTLTVAVLPDDHSDGDVVWESGNPSVLSVSSTGPTTASYVAVSESTTPITITATVGTVTLIHIVTTISADGGSGTEPATTILFPLSFPNSLAGGDTGTLTVAVLPEDHTDGDIVWESDNPSVLSVSSTGPTTASYVAGTAGGTASITMTVGAVSTSRTITVNPSGDGGSGTKSATTILFPLSFPNSLAGGDTGTLTVAVLPEDHTDGDIVWESDNPSVLSVTSTGPTTASYVAGTAGGTASITMTVGTATASRTITVTP